MGGTVFSLISGQRIVSQLCLCRFYRDSSKQLIEETHFVGLFKLVHHYGGEFKSRATCSKEARASSSSLLRDSSNAINSIKNSTI